MQTSFNLSQERFISETACYDFQAAQFSIGRHHFTHFVDGQLPPGGKILRDSEERGDLRQGTSRPPSSPALLLFCRISRANAVIELLWDNQEGTFYLGIYGAQESPSPLLRLTYDECDALESLVFAGRTIDMAQDLKDAFKIIHANLFRD